MSFEADLASSLSYLRSDQAIEDVKRDPYWPKWHSPWWHMLLLHEMGETHQIPEAILRAFVSRLDQMPLKIFPIHEEEMPAGIDPYRDSPCHCQLGNVYQVLAAWGVNVDHELPWIRPWLLRYQMADGGMSCDNEAYLVTDETPSSMVGTIAAFEAILLYTKRPWTEAETKFLELGAQFLMNRRLTEGSNTKHNASERESAKSWLQLCFPRFYFYDVLRGLSALLAWSEKTNQQIPRDIVESVRSAIESRFPDGQIRIERQCYEGVGTILPARNGEWVRRQPATFFPLLRSVSRIGDVSPFLSKEWDFAKKRML